jgi:hypothetical protein
MGLVSKEIHTKLISSKRETHGLFCQSLSRTLLCNTGKFYAGYYGKKYAPYEMNEQNTASISNMMLEFWKNKNVAISSTCRSSGYLQIHIFKTFETIIYAVVTQHGFHKKLYIVRRGRASIRGEQSMFVQQHI